MSTIEFRLLKEVEAILDNGILINKLMPEVAEKLKIAYATQPKALGELIDLLPFLQLPKELQNKTFDELYRNNELEIVRINYPAIYEKLKSEKNKKN